MSKFKIILLIVFFISLSAQAGYVRKLKEPVFFIPEGQGMHVQEKLPPVNIPQKRVMVKKEKEEILIETPEYKRKYDDYLKDIDVFVKTKEMPRNEELDNDLKAMETGDVFEVIQNGPLKIETEEQKAFYETLEEVIKD